MRFNKKAALELSITAIVVLIIAITVLGLGIGFIKKQFGAGTQLVSQEFSNIKEQMKEQVRTGGELLVYSNPEKVSIGKPESVIIGVRNTLANQDTGKVCFVVEVRCIQPFTPDTFCDPTGRANNIVVGGIDSENWQAVSGNNNWFRSILGKFDLKNYEGDVFDAVMLVRGIKPDAYQMEINVYGARAPDYKDCSQFDFQDAREQLYASKTFILQVV